MVHLLRSTAGRCHLERNLIPANRCSRNANRIQTDIKSRLLAFGCLCNNLDFFLTFLRFFNKHFLCFWLFCESQRQTFWKTAELNFTVATVDLHKLRLPAASLQRSEVEKRVKEGGGFEADASPEGVLELL